MARDWPLIAVVLVAACGKSSEPAREPPPAGSGSGSAVVTSPECAEKVKELGPWLEQLAVEQASHEIDFGYKLQVIERAPLPMPRKIDLVMVKAKSLDAYDLAGTKHEELELANVPAQKDLEAALAQMFATKPDAVDKALPPPDLLRIDVDVAARWSEVVRVVDAATKAGYARVMFGFTATSKLQPPIGLPLEVTDADAISKANHRLEEIGDKDCKPLFRAAVRHEWNPDRAEDVRTRAREKAAAIAACNCAASPDEIRALAWVDAHWHQATIRVPLVVSIGGASPAEIALAKSTPWSDAHARLVAAAPDGQPPPLVKLVAK